MAQGLGHDQVGWRNDEEGIAPEQPGILGGLATRLQEGLRATIVALGQSHAQRLAAIVESSNDAILSVDLDGNIATWNRGAEKLLGYTADEVIGKPIRMLISTERQHEEPEILERIGRGESVREYETQRLRKDGTPIAVSLSVSPIMDAGGTIIGASKIGRERSRSASVPRRAGNCCSRKASIASGTPLRRCRRLRARRCAIHLPRSRRHSRPGFMRWAKRTTC
jgi:PAS domain S-box-containing protein